MSRAPVGLQPATAERPRRNQTGAKFTNMLTIIASPDHRIGQILRFGATSGMSAAITVGLPVALHEGLGVVPQHGAAIAFCVAFLVNFFSLRRLVFRSAGGIGRDLGLFVISSLAFRAAEYAAFLALTTFAHVYYVVALVGVLGLSTVAKFFWYRKALHRKQACQTLIGSG